MDRREFESLALEQLDAVYRLAVYLTRDANEAEDLVQEVYARALRPRSAEGFVLGPGGIRPWLFTIAHNVFFSEGRRRSRAASSVGEVEAASDGRAPDEPPPAWDLASLDWEGVDERLKGAIDALSAEHREVLLLWGVEGLKYRQIAEIVGVPIGTVMSRLHRARKLVADRLVESGAAADGLTVRGGAGAAPAGGEP